MFNRFLRQHTKWMVVCIVLPMYAYCASIIGNAIIKFLVVELGFNYTQQTLVGLLNCIVDAGMLIVVALIFKDELLRQAKDFKGDLFENLKQGIIVGPVLLLMMSFVGGIVTLFFGGQASSENQVMIESIMRVNPVIMILPVVVLAPILEEIIFRGMVFGWLYEKNRILAYLGSGLLFGFIHVMVSVRVGNISELIQIFSYMFMGFVLSYLYDKSNNIYVPILSHCINNSIAIIIMLFM